MKVAVFLHDEELESLPSDVDRHAIASATSATYVIHQDVEYRYTRPVTDLRQRLVILPRRVRGDQRRVAHRFEVRAGQATDNTVQWRTDRFGNSVFHVAAPQVRRTIEFRARAVLTRDLHSVATPAWHAPHPTVTRLTAPDAAIRDAAAELRTGSDVPAAAVLIAEHVNASIEYRHDATSVRTTAAEAWQLRAGVCQDMAHVMIAMCSSLGIAARYVSGHLVGDGASHAWVEVFDPRHDAVIAIDPTHSRRTDLRYLTTAAGRDYRDVAPTAGSYFSNGGQGSLVVRKRIRVADLS